MLAFCVTVQRQGCSYLESGGVHTIIAKYREAGAGTRLVAGRPVTELAWFYWPLHSCFSSGCVFGPNDSSNLSAFAHGKKGWLTGFARCSLNFVNKITVSVRLQLYFFVWHLNFVREVATADDYPWLSHPYAQ